MKKIIMMMFVLAFIFAMAVPGVQAIPILNLYDVGTSTGVSIVDGQIGLVSDANGTAGVITWIGSLGVWTVNVTTGITMPATGSALVPSLDLNSVDISSGAGTLWIWFSETGFGPFSGIVNSSVGGTTPGTTSFQTILGPSTIISSLGPFGGPAFSGSTSTPVSFPSGSTLELLGIITHGGPGTTSFNTTAQGVPEPGTLLLLGSGFAGLAFYGRLRSRKQ